MFTFFSCIVLSPRVFLSCVRTILMLIINMDVCSMIFLVVITACSVTSLTGSVFAYGHEQQHDNHSLPRVPAKPPGFRCCAECP